MRLDYSHAKCTSYGSVNSIASFQEDIYPNLGTLWIVSGYSSFWRDFWLAKMDADNEGDCDADAEDAESEHDDFEAIV